MYYCKSNLDTTNVRRIEIILNNFAVMTSENVLTKKLHIDHPFVQAPMLGVTTPEMVASISNAGALGSLPIGGLPPDKALALIQKTKSLTRKPFAVNLFTNNIPSSINKDTWKAMQAFIEQFSERYELPYHTQTMEGVQFFSYEEQVEILIKENIPVVSFTFGILNDDVINAFHKKGMQLIGTATSVEEAKLLSDKGIDMIVVQGIEAGGHRGTFLHEHLPQTGLMALLPKVVDAVDEPVLAAGAIANGSAIKAAIMLGAKGVQVGTAFITCNESAANTTYKENIWRLSDTGTVLTRSYTGKWLRCIKNEFTEMVDASGLAINEYPVQSALTAFLRTLHENKDAVKFLPMLTGQNPRISLNISAAEILMDMIKEAEA
jgi:nitronate monooxygenase